MSSRKERPGVISVTSRLLCIEDQTQILIIFRILQRPGQALLEFLYLSQPLPSGNFHGPLTDLQDIYVCKVPIPGVSAHVLLPGTLPPRTFEQTTHP